jgi:hypothetical protein
MRFSLFRFILALNSPLLFWKPLGFEFLLGIADIFPCSLSTLEAIILLQLLMLFVGTSTYLEPKLILWIIFYNGTFLFIKILIILKMNMYIHSFLHRIMVLVVVLYYLLLLSE